MTKTGIQLITEERELQIKKLGFTLEYDLKNHNRGDLLRLASYLISADSDYYPHAFNKDFVAQLFVKPRVEQLSIAGALIAAEIDYIQYHEHYHKQITNESNEPC